MRDIKKAATISAPPPSSQEIPPAAGKKRRKKEIPIDPPVPKRRKKMLKTVAKAELESLVYESLVSIPQNQLINKECKIVLRKIDLIEHGLELSLPSSPERELNASPIMNLCATRSLEQEEDFEGTPNDAPLEYSINGWSSCTNEQSFTFPLTMI